MYLIGTGDARGIANSPIAPALVSLILTGAVGQSQHAADVIAGNLQVYFEFAASSKKELCEQFPILNGLDDHNFFCGDPKEDIPEDTGDDSHAFAALCERAERNGDVQDSDVEYALRKLFKTDPNLPFTTQAGRPTCKAIPFIHTRHTLEIMGFIARRQTIPQVSSECEDTHFVRMCVPILLSGDTGTGKTYLLFKYLELLRSSGCLMHLSNDVSIFTLSAKFLRSSVENLGKKMKETMSEAHSNLSPDEPRKVCAFILDEVFMFVCGASFHLPPIMSNTSISSASRLFIAFLSG